MEKMVPMSYSLADWNKAGMTPAEYHEKNPGAKWKVVHCHKEGHIGEALPGSSDMSYEAALRKHRAIEWRKHGG